MGVFLRSISATFAIERLVIIGIHAEPLRADRVVLRHERLGNGRLANDRAYLGPEELRCRIVGDLVGE